MKPTLARELALDALLMALWRRKPSGPVIVHSDQGSQYGSDDWQRFCCSHDLQPSMSRRTNRTRLAPFAKATTFSIDRIDFPLIAISISPFPATYSTRLPRRCGRLVASIPKKKACITAGLCFYWCRHPDSNWGPTDYKSVALPTELCRRRSGILAGPPRRVLKNTRCCVNRCRWCGPGCASRSGCCRRRPCPASIRARFRCARSCGRESRRQRLRRGACAHWLDP